MHLSKLNLIYIFLFILMLGRPAFAENEDLKISHIETQTEIERREGVHIKEETNDTGWANGNFATGNFGGLRDKLEEKGISLEVVYFSEPFFKTHGGLTNHSKIKYLGAIDFTMTLDTEKLGLWKGGTLFLFGENIHGQGLTNQQIGDIQTISSFDAPTKTHFAEFWYEHQIIEDRLIVKVGKQDANADFAALDICGDYINSSFTLNPTIPMPTYPDPGLGAAIFVNPFSELILKAGIYDGEPRGHLGFKTAFDGQGGSFVIVESSIEHESNNLNGKFMVGYWHHSADMDEITNNLDPIVYKGNHGVYSGFSQMLYREHKDSDDSQGLTLHGQFGWSPANRNEIAYNYSGGLAYTGLIPHRENDVTGIGFTTVDLSRRLKHLEDRTAETALEIFHKFQLTPFLSIQPDLQYIFRPNGNLNNALAIGVRSIICF